MNTYLMILKSHIDYPDYKCERIAKNRKNAVEIFWRQFGTEFNRKFINANIVRIYKNGKEK